MGVGGELVSYLGVQSLFIFFLIKENWICAMTRHHAEPNINILLTRNPHLESDVRQWSHPLMIPLHCLWAKSNNRTRHKFEYDVTLLIFLLFLFDFVDSHARCSCCFIVCLRFQVMQMKQKWAKCFLKSVFLRKHFVIFLENGTHKNVKPRKSNSEALAQPWPQRNF